MKKLLSFTKNNLLFKSNGDKKKTKTKPRKKKTDFEFQFAMGKVIEEPLSFYANDLDN
ncbi:hypothetical protein [Microscilla marina]|uniref:Uncharacterized protein n=1 Tax=Microscilla marina ATCC 23134 TaxID=313606 RepID=A1ZCP9_MICM2|nr:hypothetical protein [Microscilla marina]EAY32051.1 hypothetical protein M23134_02080 [Microscilla marina ATCC 23134]